MADTERTDETGDFVTADHPDPLPSIDGFEILALAGRGGMGRVYQARQIGLDRVVAVKVLSVGSEPRFISRFVAEAQSAARVRHEHIAAIYDVNGSAPAPYYVMEYASHGTLSDRLKGQPIRPRDAAQLLIDLARAVQCCHDHGLIHRDLKPGNVLFTQSDGRIIPKISDFGLVKRTDTDDAKLTKTGEILGTPSYMAPEQAGGVVTKIGPAVDIYALGAILYECLTGRPPFVGTDPFLVVMALLTDDPLRPRDLEPSLSRNLETITLKCLEKQPRKRYLRAADLAADLQRWLNGEPIVARPAGWVERSGKWVRRRPWQAATVAAGLALVIGSITAAVLFNQQARQLAITNDGLVKSKAETDRVLSLTLDAADQYYFGIHDKLLDLPKGEKLRREVIEQARMTVPQIETIRPNDLKLREFQAYAWLKLGGIEQQDGRLSEAAEAFERARILYANLTRLVPDLPDYRIKETVAAFRKAQARQSLGDQDSAGLLVSATESAEALYREFPGNPEVLLIAAVAASERFKSAVANGTNDAEEHLVRTVALRRQRALLLTNDPAAIVESLSADLLWGEWQVLQGKTADAEKSIQAVADQLAKSDPDSIAFRKLFVLAQQSLARLAVKRQDGNAAVEAYRAIVEVQRRTANERPDAPTPRRELIVALREWSRLATQAGQSALAKDAQAEADRSEKERP